MPVSDRQATASHHERFVPGTETWARQAADHATDFVRARSVLDAGTGPGYGAALLAASGAGDVQAVDIDQPSIELAARTYRADGLRFFVDDCETLARVDGPLDVICSFENIEHLHHPDRFLEQAARLLTDDGVLLCSTPDKALTGKDWKDGKPANPYHINEWTIDEFREILARYFHEVEVRCQVTAFAFVRRRHGVEQLTAHLTYLWSNPVQRLGRVIANIVGRSRSWPDVSTLAVPSPSDFPIVPALVAAEFGEPWCHFAICKGPRR
jgi:SAM-dependent methyltransferase